MNQNRLIVKFLFGLRCKSFSVGRRQLFFVKQHVGSSRE